MSVLVQPVLRSDIISIARPDISSMKGTSIFINLCSSGFKSSSILEEKGIDLFRKMQTQVPGTNYSFHFIYVFDSQYHIYIIMNF